MPTATDHSATRFLPFPPPTAVVKLGGSLLDLTDLSDRLDQLRPQWGERPLLVVGGGPAADLVRNWDQHHQLGEARSHWLALDSLMLTSQLLATLWSNSRVAEICEIETDWQLGRIPVVQAKEWFECMEQLQRPVPPQTWATTTDTIAAWIASISSAEALWLLKSVDAPGSLSEARRQELVDPHFADWAPRAVPLVWINLRTETQTLLSCEPG